MKVTEPVCERIFEQTKHQIVIVLVSDLTVLSYLNLSSVIPRGKRHFFTQQIRKSLFIAEPCSDFNCCYEQQTSEKHNQILFIALSLLHRLKVTVQGHGFLPLNFVPAPPEPFERFSLNFTQIFLSEFVC